MQSSNPVLSRAGAFGGGAGLGAQTASASQLQDMYDQPTYVAPAGARMTIDDVVAKTAMMLVVLVATATAAWTLDLGIPIMIGAALVGFGLALVNSFKKVVSPPLVIAYAAVEGVFLGILSNVLASAFPGIALQAVLGTSATFAVMLALYKSGRVRATPKFRKIMLGMTGGYMVFLLINLGFNAFGGNGINLWERGLLSFAISIFAVGLASFFLILDFDIIEKGVAAGVPERESWRAAFGLMVTLIWLYIEMLRLIAILRGD